MTCGPARPAAEAAGKRRGARVRKVGLPRTPANFFADPAPPRLTRAAGGRVGHKIRFTEASETAAFETAAMAGWTVDNSGATSSRPITKGEEGKRVAEGLLTGALLVLPVGEFLGPLPGRAVSAVARGADASADAVGVGEQAAASVGRASRVRARNVEDVDPVPPYQGREASPPGYDAPPPYSPT